MRQYNTFAQTEALLLTAIGLPDSSIKTIAAATGMEEEKLAQWTANDAHPSGYVDSLLTPLVEAPIIKALATSL